MNWRSFLTTLLIGMAILIPAALLSVRLDLNFGGLKVKQAAGEQFKKELRDTAVFPAGNGETAEKPRTETERQPTAGHEERQPRREPAEQPGHQEEPTEQPEKHSRVVYLTFDDGPNTVTTPQILDILKRHGVKATFFVTGRNARLNPGVLRRIREEGHAIGNHSYCHDYAAYRDQAAFASDLELAAEAIEAVTGTRPVLYRPPGGTANLNHVCREILAERGYRIAGWNVSSADTDPHGVTPEQLINNVLEGVARVSRKGAPAVILMHDGAQTGGHPAPGTPGYIYVKNREADVAALPVIIRTLKEQGFTFSTLAE